MIKQLLKSKASSASLFLWGNIFLFQPLFLYVHNHTFLYSSFFSIFLYLFPLFILFYLAFSALSCIKLIFFQKYYPIVLTALAVTCWAATFFHGTSGSLDGKSFGLITDARLLEINFFLLTSIFLMMLALAKYKQKVMHYLLMTMSLIYFVWMGFFMASSMGQNKTSGVEQKLLAFSSQQNILVILLDTFQSDFFQAILKKNPDLAKELTGFTYYPYATGVAPTTFMSVPAIHSSQVYQSDESVQHYYDNAILKNSFMSAHAHSGYQSLLINPFMNYCPPHVICATQNDIYYGQFKAMPEALVLLNISLMNISPHYVKSWIYRHGKWRFHLGDQPTQLLSNNVLSALTHLNAAAKKPTIKFLHLFSSHAPGTLDAACQKLAVPIWNIDSAINQDTCAFSNVIPVLRALKKENLYHNTAILIIADHGAGFVIPPRTNYMDASANPLFLYKPFKDDRAFQVSDKLVSLIDIPATLCAASHACQSQTSNGFDIIHSALNTTRQFRFNQYRWDGHAFDLEKPYPVFAYNVIENKQHELTWQKTGYSKKLIKNIPFGDDIFLNYAGDGWERGGMGAMHIWSIGKKSELFLPFIINHAVTLHFSASTHSQNQHQSISIWANNYFVGRYPIDANKENDITFSIPANVIQTAQTHIVFTYAQDNYPNKEDQRQLSVSFEKSLEIL